MKVRIIFFGATAAAAETREIQIIATPNTTIREMIDDVVAKYPKLAAHRLLFAVNQAYSDGSELINDEDELAIFTAVSGG